MEMLFLSFVGSALAYFAFMSAASSASSAASAANAAASNWPPTAAQQAALQAQIGQLVAEVTGEPLSTEESASLSQLLASAPSNYVATPGGAPATFAGYQAWVLAGSAASAVQAAPPAQAPSSPSSWTANSFGASMSP